MTSPKGLLDTAGAAGVLGIRLAHTLYSRWRRLAPGDRERLEPLAEDAKGRALELRGTSDPEGAGRDLNAVNRSLAEALLASAEADPELPEIEVHELRSDLKRELDRLASGEVKASRGAAREPAGESPPAGPG
ncbi:MAG TPA: hypothetical protein VGV10_00265 [Thermoleophilaceae bacterium]|nr:hypothetical protein [Thermoleophilaceae bacterium]